MRDVQARVATTAKGLWALAPTGVVRPYRPDRLYRIAKTLVHWDTGPAGGYTAWTGWGCRRVMWSRCRDVHFVEELPRNATDKEVNRELLETQDRV